VGFPFLVADAFAEKAFAGNPAAVVFQDEARDDAWRASVAREFALSETAFVEPRGDAFGLRWYTPAVEVPLCGHATLAAAHALWETGRLPRERPAVFETKSGRLEARLEDGWITLDFPALPPVPAKPPAGLLEVLQDTPLWLGENRQAYFLELDSEDTVRRAAPDLAKLKSVTSKDLVLTAAARRGTCDFVSRCFCPACGIPEDPVTGSAHCALGPYWAGRLGKQVLTAFQASARGGVLIVRVGGERVELGGKAVTVSRGELLV
jgi:PhzF family phenazine biosynthesis protein